MSSALERTPDERRGRLASEPVALMRSLVIVVAHEARERPLQSRAAGEVAPPEGDAPMLLQDRALQPLDESVGPRMARLGAGMTQAKLSTRLIEGAVSAAIKRAAGGG